MYLAIDTPFGDIALILQISTLHECLFFVKQIPTAWTDPERSSMDSNGDLIHINSVAMKHYCRALIDSLMSKFIGCR
jgi:hypothetical protein